VAGRPLLNLSFALCYAAGGESVGAYHAFNLAIHILAGLTLFGVARRTLDRMRGTGFQPVVGNEHGLEAHATFLALAIAVLWTLDPLQTSTVTYIAQRSEAMMGLFYLLTLYGFIRHADEAESGKRKAESGNTRPGRKGRFPPSAFRFPLLSVSACFLGMATKEVMVTAPVIVFLYDRTFVSGSFRLAWQRHWRIYLGLASSWIVLGCLITGLHDRGVGGGLGVSGWEYGLAECRVVLNYLRLAVWPNPLVLDYGPFVRAPFGARLPWVLVLLLPVAGVAVALWRRPVLGFLGCWFLVILAPTSSFVPVVLQPMAENRLYLPLVAVIALAVCGIHSAMRLRPGTILILGGVAVAFGGLTLRRNEDYRSAVALWADTVAKVPDNPRAHYNLAIALLGDGRAPEAIEHLETALRIYPSYPDAHFNLGLALQGAGRLPEAIDQYHAALALKPGFPKAEYDLGTALVASGELPDAIGHFEAAVQLDRDFADARAALATALFQSGQTDDAIPQFREAVRLRPASAELRNRLGIALAVAGRLPEAVPQFEAALQINPRSSQTHINLGSALANENRLDEAVAQFEAALALDPASPEARTRLQMALQALGHPSSPSSSP